MRGSLSVVIQWMAASRRRSSPWRSQAAGGCPPLVGETRSRRPARTVAARLPPPLVWETPLRARREASRCRCGGRPLEAARPAPATRCLGPSRRPVFDTEADYAPDHHAGGCRRVSPALGPWSQAKPARLGARTALAVEMPVAATMRSLVGRWRHRLFRCLKPPKPWPMEDQCWLVQSRAIRAGRSAPPSARRCRWRAWPKGPPTSPPCDAWPGSASKRAPVSRIRLQPFLSAGRLPPRLVAADAIDVEGVFLGVCVARRRMRLVGLLIEAGLLIGVVLAWEGLGDIMPDAPGNRPRPSP